MSRNLTVTQNTDASVEGKTISAKIAALAGKELPPNTYLLDKFPAGTTVQIVSYEGDFTELVSDGTKAGDIELGRLYTIRFIAEVLLGGEKYDSVREVLQNSIIACKIKGVGDTKFENCYDIFEVAKREQQQRNFRIAQQKLRMAEKGILKLDANLQQVYGISPEDDGSIKIPISALAIGVAAQSAILQDKLTTGGENAEDIRATRNEFTASLLQMSDPALLHLVQSDSEQRKLIASDAGNTAGVTAVVHALEERDNAREERDKAKRERAEENRKRREAEARVKELEAKRRKRVGLPSIDSGGEATWLLTGIDKAYNLRDNTTLKYLKALGVADRKSTASNIIPTPGYEGYFRNVKITNKYSDKSSAVTTHAACTESGTDYILALYAFYHIPHKDQIIDLLGERKGGYTYWGEPTSKNLAVDPFWVFVDEETLTKRLELLGNEGVCEECGATKHIDLHHLQYPTYSAEDDLFLRDNIWDYGRNRWFTPFMVAAQASDEAFLLYLKYNKEHLVPVCRDCHMRWHGH